MKRFTATILFCVTAEDEGAANMAAEIAVRAIENAYIESVSNVMAEDVEDTGESDEGE